MNTEKEQLSPFTPPENPYDLFHEWLSEAEKSEINDPGAMCLATISEDGKPSARMVLLKEASARGFKFHSNGQSRKGKELEQNSNAALCFHWKSLRKQVRVEGIIHTVSEEESDAYFKTRSRQSQLGAWASRQSRTLDDYQTLIDAHDHYQEKFKDEDQIPKPDYWIGYRLEPTLFEFWQDGAHRLHQRHVYTPDGDNWAIGMLYP